MKIKVFLSQVYFKIRKVVYASCSNNNRVVGTYKSNIPVVIRGEGQVVFGEQVNFGVINSPFFYNSYVYIEARNDDSVVSFGKNIHINNAFSIISEKEVHINDNVLIGFNCTISDSNFHNLEWDKRHEAEPEPKAVIICKNVFIGNNVTILKGVTIGENSIIAACSVVTKSFPENVIIGGCPAKILKRLESSCT